MYYWEALVTDYEIILGGFFFNFFLSFIILNQKHCVTTLHRQKKWYLYDTLVSVVSGLHCLQTGAVYVCKIQLILDHLWRIKLSWIKIKSKIAVYTTWCLIPWNWKESMELSWLAAFQVLQEGITTRQPFLIDLEEQYIKIL